ncbi:MAG: nuclear transport factor 2 family protein [Candidatus Limnocylindrales bacterium]
MNADPKTESAVRLTLDRLAGVYVTRDAAMMRAVFAPDPDVVMYTPGAEAIVGLSAIVAKAEGDWSRSDAASLTYVWMSISAAGPVAWAAADADFTVRASGRQTTIPAHITFVLEQRGEQWLIQQAHYSFAAPPADNAGS